MMTVKLIVVSDSAGGGLVAERDSKIHAILPLRGKVLNIIDRDLEMIAPAQRTRHLVIGHHKNRVATP
jgi:DNA gyrase/topoisomerase IV subunit B